MWTLLSTRIRVCSRGFAEYVLEQNIYANIGPVVGKVMIVCPVTLINVRVSTFDVAAADLSHFTELEERISQMVRPTSHPVRVTTCEPLRQAREGPCRDLRRRQGQAKDQAICEFVNSIPITSSADPDIATRTEFSRIHHVLIIGYERLRTVM